MKTVFTLKDLVKYTIFIGVVYALFKLIPSQPFSQRDLILIVAVIGIGFVFIDCYSSKEGFADVANVAEANSIKSDTDVKMENVNNVNNIIKEEDAEAEEEADVEAEEGDDEEGGDEEGGDEEGVEAETEEGGDEEDEEEPSQTNDLLKYNTLVEKSRMRADKKVANILSSNNEKKRFQGGNVLPSNTDKPAAGCGVEMEKLKRQVSQHINQLEEKIKVLENQPVDENMEKYKNFLMKDLKEVGVMDEMDIQNLNAKIENKVMSMTEAIEKLEKLKLSAKPKMRKGKAKNEYDYSELPKDFYSPLGDPELSKWDTAFHMLNTTKWQVPMPRPPVCINTSPCKVCPTADQGGYPLKLTDWDSSRKVMNMTVNKQWANDQMDFNTANELNIASKINEEQEQEEVEAEGDFNNIHPPVKKGGFVDAASSMSQPQMNQQMPVMQPPANLAMPPMAPIPQVQSFRNVAKPTNKKKRVSKF